MLSQEIAKDILVALIQKINFGSVDAVCDAYKTIVEAVDDTFTN